MCLLLLSVVMCFCFVDLLECVFCICFNSVCVLYMGCVLLVCLCCVDVVCFGIRLVFRFV